MLWMMERAAKKNNKCGIFLSNLDASNEETQITKDKVDAIN